MFRLGCDSLYYFWPEILVVLKLGTTFLSGKELRSVPKIVEKRRFMGFSDINNLKPS